MQQTLFVIPREWFDGPLLVGWLIVSVIVMVYLVMRHGFTQEAWSFLPVAGVVAAVIAWVLPGLQVAGVNPADPTGPLIPHGLAIRGYGVFLLLAIVGGVGISMLRARQAGIDPDRILSLAFLMIICGLVGARLFYVIQKSDQFFADVSFQEGLIKALRMTEGGLVVYGSLIGGMLAAAVYCRLKSLPLLRAADVLAPGMMLGLALGRIGCLMNGCCYGGVCENEQLGLQFPAGSAPYMQQLQEGGLLGLTTVASEATNEYVRNVVEVEPDSLAAKLGVKPGDELMVTYPRNMSLLIRFFKQPALRPAGESEWVLYLDSQQQGRIPIPFSELPARSLAVYPTQIYSAINAGLLSLFLWFFWKFRRHDGEAIAWLLILYPIARFALEMVRNDEKGLFGSSLTISQWVSIGTILVGMGLLAFVKIKSEPIHHSDPYNERELEDGAERQFR